MIAVEWGAGQVFWSMFWFFLMLCWILLVIRTLMDVFRNDDLGGWGKAIWTLVILVLPFLGLLIYLATHSQGIARRSNEGPRGYVSNSDWQQPRGSAARH